MGILRELAALARASGRIGVDTEFMSEGRYRPLLCLVQVAVADETAPGGIRIGLIDPLDSPDVTALSEVAADPAVEVVIHAARQDVTILRRAWGVPLTNLFDTQVAAGFAGLGAQVGYGNLLSGLLGIQLAKSAGYTRWDQRPLTSEQVRYAREDVEHLLQLADELQARLRAAGRLEWAREECTERFADLREGRDPETVWRRLPKVSHLGARARTVARELAAWRERTAAAEDRPSGSVLPDQAVVELARRQPRQVGALGEIRGLQPSVLRRRADDVIAAVARGLELPPMQTEPGERLDLRPEDAPLVALSEAVVRDRVAAAGLAYELVASRSELERLVVARRRGETPDGVRVLEGWRRELAGGDLLDLLDGRLSLAVGGNHRLQVSPRADPTG